MSEDKIEKLNKSLYSRNAPSVRHKKTHFSVGNSGDIKTDWEHEEVQREEIHLNTEYQPRSSSFLKKVLILSIAFFILALSFGAYVLFKGNNIISANNVDITVSAPVSVGAGEVLTMDIKVHNNNNIKLEVVDLSIEFPSGTVDPNDTTKELLRYRQLMDDIEPNGFSTKKVQAVVYGEENSKKEIKMKVEYRVKNSNAINVKEKSYDILISNAPVTLTIKSFDEVNAQQEFELEVEATSNSKDILRNVLLKSIYPSGFTFISSTPKVSYDNNGWKLGDMVPGAKRVIKIKGKIDGQDTEERVFRFQIGSQSSRNEKIIGTEYLSTLKGIYISKPFLGVNLKISGNSDTLNLRAGRRVSVDIDWVNNLSNNINNAEIKVSLSGTAYDRNSVSASYGGYFRSSDNSIVWDRTNYDDFVSISPNADGKLSFSLTPLVSTVVNPEIKFDISVKGTRLSENNVPQSISNTLTKVARVISEPRISGQLVRSLGSFQNKGPIPPVADSLTTYTVVWTVSNTSSNIIDATVTSKLPPYVKWTGETSLSEDDLTYNPVTSEIIWKVGDIKAYSGVSGRQQQAEFQIGFEPSLSHVGRSPILVEKVVLSGKDQFTGVMVGDEQAPLTTRFSTDPEFKSGYEIVNK